MYTNMHICTHTLKHNIQVYNIYIQIYVHAIIASEKKRLWVWMRAGRGIWEDLEGSEKCNCTIISAKGHKWEFKDRKLLRWKYIHRTVTSPVYVLQLICCTWCYYCIHVSDQTEHLICEVGEATVSVSYDWCQAWSNYRVVDILDLITTAILTT